MKISLLFLGFAAFIGIIQTSTDIHYMLLYESVFLEQAEGEFYFGMKAPEEDDIMNLEILVQIPYEPIYFDFQVNICGLTFIPNTKEEIFQCQSYNPYVYNNLDNIEQFDRYIYTFQRPSNIVYFCFYFVTNSRYNIYFRVNTIDEEAYEVKRVGLLTEFDIKRAFGQYYLGILAQEDDDVNFEVKVMKPIYDDNIDFLIYVTYFPEEPLNDNEIINSKNYKQLEEYNPPYSTNEYVLYSYPLSTTYNVGYLGFYIATHKKYHLKIYIKSRKTEEAASYLALIIILIILVIAGIGAGATFIYRKFGCCDRLNSSSI